MRGHAPYWIDPSDQNLAFPDVGLALRQPDGLLAIGGDLSPARLTAAYRRGIFPWYNDDQPILWWSPDPRAVILPDAFHLSRSLRKTLRQQIYTVTIDQAFAETISACAAPRTRQDGTWITDEMRNAYIRLHELKLAHSVECWQEGELVGGIYGISLGRVFFGESMFSRRSNASKIAIAYLVAQLQRWDFGLLDCQIASAHLGTLGAVSIARPRFLQLLHEYCDRPAPPMPWHFDLPPDWWKQ